MLGNIITTVKLIDVLQKAYSIKILQDFYLEKYETTLKSNLTFKSNK